MNFWYQVVVQRDDNYLSILAVCLCKKSRCYKTTDIFSRELQSTLFVPPRMKTCFILTIFREIQLFNCYSMFWKIIFVNIRVPAKFYIKESPINNTFAGNCWNKKLCSLNCSFLATEEEPCILWNMFCKIKSIVFKIKIAHTSQAPHFLKQG